MMQKLSILTVSAVFVLGLFSLTTAVLAQDADEPVQRRGSQRSAQAQMDAAERQERVDQLRQERTADIQERVAERQAQVRQDICERREQQVSRLIPRLSNGSSRVLGSIDSVYERVQSFYDDGQLTVENYDELNDAVAAARMKATAAVEAVSTNGFTLDCDNPSVGDQLFGFRESVADTRDELKTYRAELVNLISSLRSAAAEQVSDVDEEEADETNDTEEVPSDNGDEGGEDA